MLVNMIEWIGGFSWSAKPSFIVCIWRTARYQCGVQGQSVTIYHVDWLPRCHWPQRPKSGGIAVSWLYVVSLGQVHMLWSTHALPALMACLDARINTNPVRMSMRWLTMIPTVHCYGRDDLSSHIHQHGDTLHVHPEWCPGCFQQFVLGHKCSKDLVTCKFDRTWSSCEVTNEHIIQVQSINVVSQAKAYPRPYCVLSNTLHSSASISWSDTHACQSRMMWGLIKSRGTQNYTAQ